MRPLFTIDPSVNGKGPVVFAWQKDGNYLATAGSNRRVHIFDRQGKLIHQIPLSQQGECIGLDWDKDGEVLAILQDGGSMVPLWNLNTKKLENLETGMQNLSFLKWSKVGPQLAIGTAKGSLLLYNRKTFKKIPILGKHTKRITCGAWNLDNKLALGSIDKQLTISNDVGDTLDQTMVKFDPMQITFSEMKEDTKSTVKEKTVSANMGGKTLLLYNIETGTPPIELSFQQRYGRIMSYRWFGDGYILIGFQTGYVVIISTYMKEIGQEINSAKFHREMLNHITYSPALQKGASIGDSCVKIFDMSDMADLSDQRSEKFEIENEFGTLERVHWTDDGQILTVSSVNGYIYTFLTLIPVIHDSYETRVLYLTSLRQLCIKDVVANEEIMTISIEVEPSFVALGPNHAAVGMNNRVWYYRISEGQSELIGDKEYLSTVEYLKLSKIHSAVLSGGKVILQLIDSTDNPHHLPTQKIFPEKENEADITCMTMTPDFLIYSTSRGTLHYFSLEDWCFVNEFRFDVGISKFYANTLGTRLVLVDETNAGYLYSAVNDQCLKIDKFAGATEKVMWDLFDWGVFVTADNKRFTTYVYSPNSKRGPTVEAVKQITLLGRSGAIASDSEDLPLQHTDKPFGFSPIFVYNGVVFCQMASGSLAQVTLETHSCVGQHRRDSSDIMLKLFYQNMSLGRMRDAWDAAVTINNLNCWKALGEKALSVLDIDLAIRVHRRLGNAAMVLALERLAHIDEKKLLLGHIAMLQKRFSEAQDHFLQSSQPTKALEMQRDLMHWDQALKLAESLDPSQLPRISREYAQQLEFKGEHQIAYELYERALTGKDKHNDALCNAGIARTSIRLGNIRKGFTIAFNSGNKDLCRECAQIFEELKQLNDAASLYEKAEMYEQAASIYIQTKNFDKSKEIMDKVTSTRILIAYAKAKEGEGNLKEAEAVYERAKDWDNVIRLNLDNRLNNPRKAFVTARNIKSTEGATMVAKYCKATGDYKRAIEFLVLAKKKEEAFDLAQSHDEMGAYTDTLAATNQSTMEDNIAAAQYYEGKGDYEKAADFFAISNQYHRALKLYLQSTASVPISSNAGSGQSTDVINKAIDVVGKAKSEMLTHTLIDYLMGESDGVPKDTNYIFRLYMALGNYAQAIQTALIIARQEAELGNYKVAHKVLFDTHQAVAATLVSSAATTSKDASNANKDEKPAAAAPQKPVKIPSDLTRHLMLLHSYILVKVLVNMKNHTAAARMLIRVCKNMSRFVQHTVQILISTVIECQRADLKKSAFEYASLLVRPEYRAQIPAAYKPKIDRIVRKGRNEEDTPEEPLTPCPFCGYQVEETRLDCPSCKNTLPYCVATGKHMVLDNWTVCPSCSFPALHSEFTAMIASEKSCPMCDTELSEQQVASIRKFSVEEARVSLRRQQDVTSSESS